MKVFWLYELHGHGGVYQGCTGPGAEAIARRVAADPEVDGGDQRGPFPAFCVDEESFKPRRHIEDSDWMESDNDFIKNNKELVMEFLEAVSKLKGTS